MITYAQNFEDVMLARLFQGQHRGFYIDIGAWHPTVHSVTRHFYDLGWSGINVEPVQRQYRLFLEERSRDDNLNLAVGDCNGTIKFYECVDLTALSTANKKQADELQTRGYKIEAYDIDVMTMTNLTERCAAQTVDFLKVDVEGYEERVLLGVDWRVLRPRVLLIEATLPAVPITDWDNVDAVRSWDAWEPLLLDNGYIFALYDGLSRFYLRTEDKHLKKRLSLPPCVHDDIQFPQVEGLRSEVSAITADRAAKADVIDRLTVEIAALRTDRQAVVDANFRLAADNSGMAADRALKAEVIERLTEERIAVNEDRRNLAEANQRLAMEMKEIKPEVDRCAKVVEALLTKNVIQQNKLKAKNEIIRTSASRELERKALLAGSTDLVWHFRRRQTWPAYGYLVGAARESGGLRVAIDTMEIIFGISGGVETYMKMLVGALLTSDTTVTLICLPDQLSVLRAQFSSRVNYFVACSSRAVGMSVRMANRVFRKPTRLSAAKSMITYSRLAEDLGIQVLHSPVQIFSALDFRVPGVLNLHDLQHLHFPQNFRTSDIEARNYFYGLSAGLADAIIVSSDFVRNDTVVKMNVPGSKVFTVPVTWDPMVERGLETFSADQARAHYNLPPNYAIYPAQFWPHKNHARLVEALRIVRDKKPSADLKLVLTGYRGHGAWPAVEQAIDRLGLSNDVICLDYVPVDHLAGLYKAALYCVVPSTFEASSYPVIEAQVLGVPAMCSNVTSLPELMRTGAGLMFDPFNVEDIAAKMIWWLEYSDDRVACAERAAVKVRQEHSLTSYIAGVNKVYEYVQSVN